jgi:hypothetical protein
MPDEVLKSDQEKVGISGSVISHGQLAGVECSTFSGKDPKGC